jgi:hypothetical protein
MARMLAGRFASLAERVRNVLPVVITLGLLVLLIAMVASTYVGHARSPYNTCYGANGRAVSCSVLEAVR